MEGPSLVIAREELAPFVGRRVARAEGSASLDFPRLRNKTLRDVLSCGKHFLLCFDGFYVRIHFLMFGSYRVDSRREDKPPKLSLGFAQGEVNFYTCAVRIDEGDPRAVYDWSIDVLAPEWDAAAARKRVRARGDDTVCDVLMDQALFAGVGNIIKNEVLYNLRIHPETRIAALSTREITAVVDEARAYSQRFYEWKKRNELKRHWQVFRRRECAACGAPVIKRKTGKLARWSFYCEREQREHTLLR